MTQLFTQDLEQISSHYIIRIPGNISQTFPSRGMVMLHGKINSIEFIAPAEPDGNASHWLEINSSLLDQLELTVGSPAALEISILEDWPEPDLPEDILQAIIAAGLVDTWNSFTTRARWEWLRWIRSTQNPDTRSKRIQVGCSKMSKGERRPCCFDTTRCTVMDVSRSGILL